MLNLVDPVLVRVELDFHQLNVATKSHRRKRQTERAAYSVHQKNSTQPGLFVFLTYPHGTVRSGALKWTRDLGQRITPTFESN